MKKTPNSKKKFARHENLVAKALRSYANELIDRPLFYSISAGQELDRALRSCSAISDIDRIWVRWSHTAKRMGWLTDKEIHIVARKAGYPKKEEI